MYKHNIYTNPGLVGFGNYNGLGVLRNIAITAANQKAGAAIQAQPGATSEGLPTWAYIAIPVGVVTVAAIVYYKFF